MVLTRTSCQKITHANGYHSAWPGWAVSVSVLPPSQSYGFSRNHVGMWELDQKEGWVLKNWCFQTVVLEKTLESSLDSKKIKPVNPKGNQPWIFTGRTDAEAEAQYCSHVMQRANSLAKTLMLWKTEGRRRKGQQSMRFGGWMASLTQWTWVWASSGRWGRTGKPGRLQPMVSQRQTQLGDWTTRACTPLILSQMVSLLILRAASLVLLTWLQGVSWLLLLWLAIVWICHLELKEDMGLESCLQEMGDRKCLQA